MNTSKYAKPNPRPGDALILVDLQNDYLPGGAAAVPHGNDVIPVLNRYIRIFTEHELPIFATRDWHSKTHRSFTTEGGSLPTHCIAGSHGAEFPAELELPKSARIISKGTVAEKDTHSAFEDTDFDAQLKSLRAKRLFIGGLATDGSVRNTVRHALERDFQVYLLLDGSRAVDAHPGDGRKAEEEIALLGATPTSLAQVSGNEH